MKTTITYVLTALCTLCLWSGTSAQNQHAVDSLRNILAQDPVDSTRLEVYLSLSSQFIFNNPDTAVHYSELALQMAEATSDTMALAECYNYFGIVGTIQGKYVTGIENFQKAFEWYEKADDTEGAAIVINNIGVVYGYLDNYEQSIIHYKESYGLSISLGDSSGAALNLYNIAADYLEQEKYDSVKHYTLLLEDFQGEENYWNTSSLWGEIYLQENRLDSAEAAFNRYYQAMSEAEDDVQALSALLGLAEVYKEQGRLVKALQTLNKVDLRAKKNEFNDFLLEVLELRAEIENERGNFSDAYLHQTNFLALKDSLDEINNMNRISELNAKYNSEKKEKELAEMRATIAEREAKKKAQDSVTIIIACCIVFILVMMVVSILRKKKTNRILNDQNVEINLQRQKILSSINYAKKIQNSILIPERVIRKYLPDSFVYFKPKDIVSGDFYWFDSNDDRVMIATIDCTGHGVPGAFMSLIANSKLNKVVNEMGIEEPSEVLSKVHEEIVNSLNQASNQESAQDGMDMSLCVIDKKDQKLKYAGAQNPIYIVDGHEVHEIKADNFSIGGTVLSSRLNGSFRFTTKEVSYKEGTHLFMFTDGYMDQFGGEKNKKLNKSKFKSLIMDLAVRNFENAKSRMEEYFEQWKGHNPQVDDILVIGTKL